MSAKGLRDATIMMVDDELTTVEITELFLKEAGFSKFISTTDPARALEMVRRERPDVLLLDLVMPRVDGLDILAEVRNDEALEHTPVLILTVSTDADVKLRALELGVTDFLSKPVDPSELVLRLDNTLVVRRHHLQLQEMIEERTAELNLMRVRAEQASEAKSRFLANMSHELRTPITAISGYADVLLDDGLGPNEQREPLRAIRRNSERLLGLIGTLLDLCEMETGEIHFERGPCDVAHLLRGLVQDLEPRALEQGLELRLEFPQGLPPLLSCDRARIGQAMRALLSNALKFTRAGSVHVRLHYDAPSELVHLEVRDTGIGVDAAAVPGLFLEFEQADPSSSRRYEGAGLGLAFTRRLARLLGGDCRFESKQGVGTTVQLSFRAPPAALPERGGHEAASAPAAETAGTARPGKRPPRILLAEDGADNQRLISMLLTKAGAQVEIAENGRVAVERLRGDDSFDLVLMDMAMPEMDGYAAARAIRDLGYELPIIALTAHGLRGEREKCMAAGCTDFATKPIDRNALIRLTRDALQKSRALRQRSKS